MHVTVDLGHRRALVTGASRGIGKAITIALAEAGAGVAVCYLQRRPEADAVVDAIRRRGGTAVAVQADVSVGAEVAAMVAAAERDLGPIDILVNNAGVALHRGLDDL